MEKIREMNERIFRNNLLLAINEIIESKNLQEKEILLRIIPVYERDKAFNAIDDAMRLVVLSEENVGKRLLSIEETVKLIACKAPLVPIWINISLNNIQETKIVFNFETSLRFRKPSQLRNTETGHPPFKAIL